MLSADMFNSMTYQKKNKVLIIAFSLLLMIAYQLSISTTLDFREKYYDAIQASEAAANAPQNIKQLETELKKLERIIGESKNNKDDIQQNILETLSRYCEDHQISLTEFPQVQRRIHENYEQQLNVIVLRGEFIPLLQLINEFERKYELGKITSLQFQSKTDRKTKKKQLYATIYLQNIQKA